MIQLRKNGKKYIVWANRENHFLLTSLIKIANNNGTMIPRAIFIPEISNVLRTEFQNFSILKR